MASIVIFLVISLLLPDGFLFQGPVANFPVADCSSKQCVGAPDTGCIQNGICTQLVKYSLDPSKPDKVQIELFGIPPVPGSTNFWVALGVNHNADSMVSEKRWDSKSPLSIMCTSLSAHQ